MMTSVHRVSVAKIAFGATERFGEMDRLIRQPLLKVAAIALAALSWAAVCGVMQAQQQSGQVLHGHVRVQVTDRQAAFAGYLPADQTMRLTIILPLRNQAALTSLLGRLSDPASPDYRKFLSVAEFTDQFGPTLTDYQAVVSFAKANGFSINGDPVNRLIVPISGSVAEVNRAFGVRMSVYQHPTENRTFFSPDREPTLQLNVPVTHISGLDDYSLPHPMLVRRPPGTEANGVQGAVLGGSGPGGGYLGSDMRAVYYGGSTLDGTGQAIGLVEFGGYLLSDVNLTFSSANQTYKVPINNVLLNGVSLSPTGDDGEQVLDIVQAIGMAPGLSQVRVYIAPNGAGEDPFILNAMASENLAKQLSCSWEWLSADPTVDDVFFQEMAAQGQSFFTASGDYGAFDASIDPFFYPPEDQYVTAVGGTHLTTNGAGGNWVSETVWNSSGGGSGGGYSPDAISIPSWQAGLANSANGGSNTLRNVPDVAMEGDFDNYFCALGSCASDAAGTSFAAPRWAGFMALINQQAVEANNAPQGGVGFLNPALYALGEGVKASSDLHDIIVGNNHTSYQPVWFSAVPGYDLTTGWGSPTGQSFIDDIAGPQVPGFWIGSSQSSIFAAPGGSGSAKINVIDAGGFTGSVNFAITSQLPAGVTASFSPNPTNGTAVLTVSAASTAAIASTPATIVGTSGTLSATTTLTIAVNTPNFSLSSSHTTLSILPGASSTSIISVNPLYGFTGTVSLAASGLPSGVTASFSPQSTVGNSTLTLTVGASATSGTSTVTVTGVSGSLTSTTTISLTVLGPNFVLYSAGNASVGQGSSTAINVYVEDVYGFNGVVNFTISGLPSGVTAVFSPNPTGTNTILTLTSSSTAATGLTTLTVTGTSGSLTATTTIILGVFAPTFTLSVYNSFTLGQGTSGAASVYVYPQYGFTGSVKLSVAGLPTGVTALWNPNPTTSGTNLTLIASSTAPVGTYSLTITGSSGSQTATATVALSIYAPTFSLSTYGGVTLGQGSSGSVYVYVNDLYGFTGSVSLAVSGLPSGVSATISPNPTTGGSSITLTALSTASVGQYTATITGTSGTQTATTTFTVGVYAPTFSLSTYGAVTVGQGSSGSAYVYINQLYGFTGSVSLAVSGLPSGVTAAFSPNPATGSSQLGLTVGSSVPVGPYTLTITGTSGSQTSTVKLVVSVYAPTFTISDYSYITLGQGTSSTSYVYVYPSYGFAGNVNLSVTGLPSGVTASFSPNPVSPTTSESILTLTASSTAATGQYSLTLTGTSGGVTATSPLSITVGVQGFTISSYATTLGQGTAITTYTYVYPVNGFAGAVTLAASGLPSGVTASFSPNPASGGSSALTLTASSSAPLGTSTVTITGTSGAFTSSTTFPLTIATPGFTLNDYQPSLSVNQGGSVISYVGISPVAGFTGSVGLSATGLPAGVTAAFSPNPTTANATVTFTASSSAATGTATVMIVGTAGAVTMSTPVTLTVNASSFALTAAPSTLTLAAGGAEKTVLSVVDQNGFAGAATLAISGLPAGVNGTFSTNPTTASSGLTLTASGTAIPGTSTVTVTGTSGTLVSSTMLLVTVGGPQATSTALTLTAGGIPVSSVAAGTRVQAVASVNLGSTPLTQGQVNFCDATATYCDAVHLFGTAQLTNAGTATLSFVAGSGRHSLRAVFAGTNGKAVSASNASNLIVTASQPTTTTVAESGAVGNYTLTATVTGKGAFAPTGAVSFLDTSYGNAVLGQAALGAGTAALGWTGVSSASGNQTYLPSAMATGDFNGDGIPDLVAVTSNSATLSIFLGKGDGTFQATASGVQTSSYPTNVTVGDFNRDGRADLAVIMSNSNSLSIFLGNGDGTFTPSNLSPQTGSSPSWAAVGDFNGDGLQDLAVSNSYIGTITILLGQGDGTFIPVSATPTTGSSSQSIAVADFNGDGIQDLAVNTTGTPSVAILIGNGDGTFTPLSSVAGSTYSQGLAVADFNGDGKPDLAVSNSYSSTMSILLGNGDGTFTQAANAQPGYYPSTVVTGDFNGDGKPDMAVLNEYNSGLTVLLGNGDGTFTSGGSVSAPPYLSLLVAGDWNGDGVIDLAAVSNASGYPLMAELTQRTQTVTLKDTGISPSAYGTHLVEASYPGDSSSSGSVSGTVSLSGSGAQTIIFPQPAAGTAGQTATLSATASSGLPVAFTLVSGPAALSGTNNATITYTAAGTVTIAANQAGNASYAAAATVSDSITVYADAIWVANSGAAPSVLSEVGSGMPSAGTAPASKLPGGIASDAAGNIWYVGGDNALYVTNTSSRSNTYSNGGLNLPEAIAVDGAGSLWIANSGNGTISEFLNSGAPVTGSAGYSATASQAPTTAQGTPSSIAIDSSGGVWVANKAGNSVTHVFGAATPVTTPMSTAAANGSVGARP